MPEKYAKIKSLKKSIERDQQEGKLRHWGQMAHICHYLFSLEDEDLDLIRYHSWQLTGDIYPNYTTGQTDFSQDMLAEYESCRSALGDFAPAEAKDGIGFETKYGKISFDLIRYLRALNDLAHLQIVQKEPLTVLELGGGYGGLARLMLLFNPNISYVICDQEMVLFFAGIYLTHALGGDCVELIETPDFKPIAGKIMLLPEKYLNSSHSVKYDLAISQQSLQEMSLSEVEHYCSLLKTISRYLYSSNMQAPAGPSFIQDLTGFLTSNFNTVWKSQSISSRQPSSRWYKRLVRSFIPLKLRSLIKELLLVLRKPKDKASEKIIKNRTDAFIDRLLISFETKPATKQ